MRLHNLKESIVNLSAGLVRIRSRAGIDPPDQIIDFLGTWLQNEKVPVKVLRESGGEPVGLYAHLRGREPGAAICLDACLDTAPFGDEEAWHHAPDSGLIENGWLFGRGSADSKTAVAIFSHLAAAFQNETLPKGELFILFDLDEHTGGFRGIKNFLQTVSRRPDAVLIGYPGNEKLVVGSRGFLRAEVIVHGTAAHSGSSSKQGFNAILKTAQLIEALSRSQLPEEKSTDFDLGPSVSVTEVTGGEGFSVVPDISGCKIDFRLTPSVNKEVASRWLTSIVDGVDAENPGPKPTQINWKESWPAYRLPDTEPLVKEFLQAAQTVFGKTILPVVSGPSNIGNYLASQSIPALSGFGVTYSQIHGTDEAVDIETIEPVYEVYRQVVANLVGLEFDKFRLKPVLEEHAAATNDFAVPL